MTLDALRETFMRIRENRWSSAAASGYQSVCAAAILVVGIAPIGRAGIKAGAVQRDTTSPVGLEIRHYYRKSVDMLDAQRIGLFLGLSERNVGRVHGKRR